MHELFLEIRRKASGNSFMHRLDARAKLLSVLIIIFFAVLTRDLVNLLLLECFLIMLMAVARLPPGYVGKRLLLILPFGGFLAIFQLFLVPGNIIWSWQWLAVSQEGLLRGTLLGSRLLVSFSAILFLSSTTPQEDLFQGLRWFRVPAIFVTLLDLMVRYLGVVFESLHKTLVAQRARGFSLRKSRGGYLFVLRTAGNTLGTLFVRSFERSDRIYDSMQARGYRAGDFRAFASQKRFAKADAFLPVAAMSLVVFLGLGVNAWQNMFSAWL